MGSAVLHALALRETPSEFRRGTWGPDVESVHGQGLVDVVDDLKRMNDELRNENDTLSADKERLEMLEERCESLEAQLRMVGGVSQVTSVSLNLWLLFIPGDAVRPVPTLLFVGCDVNHAASATSSWALGQDGGLSRGSRLHLPSFPCLAWKPSGRHQAPAVHVSPGFCSAPPHSILACCWHSNQVHPAFGLVPEMWCMGPAVVSWGWSRSGPTAAGLMPGRRNGL